MPALGLQHTSSSSELTAQSLSPSWLNHAKNNNNSHLLNSTTNHHQTNGNGILSVPTSDQHTNMNGHAVNRFSTPNGQFKYSKVSTNHNNSDGLIRLAPQTPYLAKPCPNGVQGSTETSNSSRPQQHPDQDDDEWDDGSASASFEARRRKYVKSKANNKSASSTKKTPHINKNVASDRPSQSNDSPQTSLSMNGTLDNKKSSTAVSLNTSRNSRATQNSKSREPLQPPGPQQTPNVSIEASMTAPEKKEMEPRTSLRQRRSCSTQRFVGEDFTASFISPFPISYAGVSESAGAWGNLGHYNILHVTTSDPGQHWFTRYCCYIVHCARLRVNFPYPYIRNKMIIDDDRVMTAVEQTCSEVVQDKDSSKYQSFKSKQLSRANAILNTMKAAISTSLIRLTGYVLFKVFSRLLMSVVVHKGQLEAVQRASKTGTPLIFVPLHRSHVDYLFVTWVLFNCQIPAPIVAAGDNLNIPLFGALLRGTGGFFIKRRLESSKARRDVLYRAVLQCYMSTALHAGYNLEFFIEGGRTRTGKPAMPKGGLLSVILDAYISGLLDDAMIVPIAINYDKLVDGNFVREQLGQSKVPESFWGAVCAICKVFSTNYGQSRIDFGAPFSLKEFVQRNRQQGLTAGGSSQPPPAALLSSGFSAPVNKGHSRSYSSPVSGGLNLSLTRGAATDLHSSAAADAATEDPALQQAVSSSSLFGTELTDEFRSLVKKLGRHIVFDAERCQAIMSSNLVAWITSFEYRQEGVSLQKLSAEVDELREELRHRGRDVGFTGSAEDAVKHAVHLLGSGLIKMEGSGEDAIYKPVTLLPNVIELNYYANALLPVFALDAIVATSLLSEIGIIELESYIDCDTNISVHLSNILKSSKRLCELLAHEFVLVAPCETLSSKILSTIDRLQFSGLLSEVRTQSQRFVHYNDTTSWLPVNGSSSSDEDECGNRYQSTAEEDKYKTVYNVSPSRRSLKYLRAFSNMLSPILDAYSATTECLQELVGRQMMESEVVAKTQDIVKLKINTGVYMYGESIAADPIKNCLKMLEGEGVVEFTIQESTRVLCLSKAYDNVECLKTLLHSMAVLRK